MLPNRAAFRRGGKRGRLEVAGRLLEEGRSGEEVAEIAGVSREAIQGLERSA